MRRQKAAQVPPSCKHPQQRSLRSPSLGLSRGFDDRWVVFTVHSSTQGMQAIMASCTHNA